MAQNFRQSLAVAVSGVVALVSVSMCSAPEYQVDNSACNNTAQDQNETDIDCGGPSACPRCKDTFKCQSGSDCVSGSCIRGLCHAATLGESGASGAAGSTSVGSGGRGTAATSSYGAAGVPVSALGGGASGGNASATATSPNGGSVSDGGSASGGAESSTPLLGGGSGGIDSSGGAMALGGTSGLNTIGGVAGMLGEGGTMGIGGAVATAGALTTGGAIAAGGVATGGVATGGVATGGVATGGVATGGVATGGVATGGVATGGTTATGGTASTAGTSATSNLCSTNTPVPTTGLITDFSEFTSGTSWSSGTKPWGGSAVLHGDAFLYGTSGVTLTASITSGGRLRLVVSLPQNDFVGFGLAFDICASAATFSGVSAVVGGTLNSAVLKWQVQTSGNTPINSSTGRGECVFTSESTMWTDCYYNTLTASGVTTTPATFKYAWSQYTGGKPETTITNTELLGVQWQFECNASGGCSIDVTIDDVKFY